MATANLEHESIRTDRLDLVLLTVPEVLAYRDVARGVDLLAGRCFANPFGVLVDDLGPLTRRIDQVSRDPSVNPWLIHLIVARTENLIIGMINFHDAPDSAGMVEIGYRIVAGHRRRGYAREAVIGMFRWALRDPRVRTFQASVSPGNEASRNLVEGLGFVAVAVVEDEEDGPEIVYQLPAEVFAANYV